MKQSLHNLIRSLLISSILLTSSLVCLADSNPTATIHVNPETTVGRDTLTLGDIANVAAPEPQLTTLRAISLGYAPQVGAVREVTKQRILLALTAAGFSPEAVVLDAPPVALVKRDSQIVDPAKVREVVEHSLAANLQSAGVTAHLSRLDLPERIEVATGAIEIRASAAGVSNFLTPFSVALEFWIDHRPAKRLSVTAQLEASAQVLVATHDLPEKTRLREGDFKLETKRLERNPASYIADPIRLRGMSLVHPVARGDAITADLLASEIVVKPGDPVRIVAESGKVNLIVMGEARGSGHVGDRIQVKNLQSGLSFQALVVDEGVVSVRF